MLLERSVMELHKEYCNFIKNTFFESYVYEVEKVE